MLTTRTDKSRLEELDELLKKTNEKREKLQTTYRQLYDIRSIDGSGLEAHLNNKFQANIAEAKKIIPIEEIKKPEDSISLLIVACKAQLDDFVRQETDIERPNKATSLAMKKTIFAIWHTAAAKFYEAYATEWDANKAAFVKTLWPEIVEESEAGVAPKLKVLRDEKFYDAYPLDTVIKLHDKKLDICYEKAVNERSKPIGGLFLSLNEQMAILLARENKDYFTACPPNPVTQCYLQDLFIPNQKAKQLIKQITPVLQVLQTQIDPIVAAIEPERAAQDAARKKMLIDFKQENDLIFAKLAELEPQNLALAKMFKKVEELIESGDLDKAGTKLVKINKIIKYQKTVLIDATNLYVSLKEKYEQTCQPEIEALKNKILSLENLRENNKKISVMKKSQIAEKKSLALAAAQAALVVSEQFKKQKKNITTKIEQLEKENKAVAVLKDAVKKEIDSGDLSSPKAKIEQMKSRIAEQKHIFTEAEEKLKALKDGYGSEYKEEVEELEASLFSRRAILQQDEKDTADKSGHMLDKHLFKEELQNLQQLFNAELKQFDGDKEAIAELTKGIDVKIQEIQSHVKQRNLPQAQKALDAMKFKIKQIEDIETKGLEAVSKLNATKTVVSNRLLTADDSAVAGKQKLVTGEYAGQLRELALGLAKFGDDHFEIYRKTSEEYARLTFLQARLDEIKNQTQQAAARIQEIKKAIEDPDYWQEAVRMSCKALPDSLIVMRKMIAEYEKSRNPDAVSVLDELKTYADKRLNKGNTWRYTQFHIRDPKTTEFLDTVKNNKPIILNTVELAANLQQKRRVNGRN